MKKITREEFNELVTRIDVMAKNEAYKETLWSRIQEAQSSEPMSREDIATAIKDAHTDLKEWYPGTSYIESLSKLLHGKIIDARVAGLSVNDHMEAISKLIQWNDRPWATGLKLGYMTKDIMPTNDRIADPFCTVPRPAPKMRPKTDKELVDELEHWRTHGRTFRTLPLSRETMELFCRDAGISLETKA